MLFSTKYIYTNRNKSHWNIFDWVDSKFSQLPKYELLQQNSNPQLLNSWQMILVLHQKYIMQYLQELKLWKFEDFGWQHN